MPIQHILYDRRSRDCFEDLFVSVAAGLRCRHELMYAKSWGFKFTGIGTQPGPPLGGALSADIGGMRDPEVLRLVARFNGLEMSRHSAGNRSVELASEAVAAGTPVILEREELVEGESPLLLLTTLDDHSFYYLDYEIGKAMGTSTQVGREDLLRLASWSGAAYTFKTVAAEKLSPVSCLDTVTRSFGDPGAECAFSQMGDFARELAALPDLADETSGSPIQFAVPLFYELMRVSHGRYQFAELLNFLGDGLIIRDFADIAKDLRRNGQGWNLVRSLLIKASLTRRPAAILQRIGAKVVDLEGTERRVWERLERVCALKDEGGATSIRTPDVDPLVHQEGHSTAMGPPASVLEACTRCCHSDAESNLDRRAWIRSRRGGGRLL